jgi:hypothetical protein
MAETEEKAAVPCGCLVAALLAVLASLWLLFWWWVDKSGIIHVG